MSELSKLGTVFTTDVLVIGAGIGGVTTAAKIKKIDSTIDVLCIEMGYHGYTGQCTKAGHGFFYMSPEDDVEAMIKEQCEVNFTGVYLNDQDYMRELYTRGYTYVEEIEELGGVFAHNEDGSLHYHREFAAKKCSGVNTDIDMTVPITEFAAKYGTRFLDRCYFTDLLTKNNKCIGAVGFNIDTFEYYIINAKAVVLAANSFNPTVGSMFYSSATPTIAAYEAGAELRHVEYGCVGDLCRVNTKDFVYGVDHLIFNKNGENIFEKYGGWDYEMMDKNVLCGLIEDAKRGNYPFHVEFEKIDHEVSFEGAGFDQGMVMPLREKLHEDQHEGVSAEEYYYHPEVSVVLNVYSQCLNVDAKAKTTLPGLYGVGTIGIYGSAFGGWVHGEGVGYACRTGLIAAENVVPYIKNVDFESIDPEQVKKFKDRTFDLFNLNGKELPYQTLALLNRVLLCEENSVNKNEASIREALEFVRDMKANFEEHICVPEGDGHYLVKAIEARTMLDIMELMYMAFDTRKESRGSFYRTDYPDRDDKNWLKWIIFTCGEDGKPEITLRPVPIEKYRYKPEGWVPN